MHEREEIKETLTRINRNTLLRRNALADDQHDQLHLLIDEHSEINLLKKEIVDLKRSSSIKKPYFLEVKQSRGNQFEDGE